MAALHRRGARGFVTFNTLVFDHELREAARALAAIAEAGADAIIVQDLGMVKLARAIAPHLEIHASTQMSVTGADGVRLAQRLGASRGQCAQACRLPYEMLVDGRPVPLGDARYLLSPGDLYALRQIPEIVDIGIAALKIEGRYKDAEYVALTTRAYRQAVDEAWAGREIQISSANELQLEQVYSRGSGPYFLNGTDHQAVVKGRAPRHRGVWMGRVADVTAEGVLVEPSVANSLAPLKPGDGVVFDAADWRSPQEPEEGGRVYQAAARDGMLELRFGNGVVNTRRIRAGDLVWRTHDPNVDKAARPY